MNKHTRLKKWVTEVLCDKVMTTIQIRDAISNKSYKSSYTNTYHTNTDTSIESEQ